MSATATKLRSSATRTPLAARNQREHQPPAPPVLPKGFDFSPSPRPSSTPSPTNSTARPRKHVAFATPTEQLSELLGHCTDRQNPPIGFRDTGAALVGAGEFAPTRT